ncbi:unnamed protein product, partial [Sphagnum compactum]
MSNYRYGCLALLLQSILEKHSHSESMRKLISSLDIQVDPAANKSHPNDLRDMLEFVSPVSLMGDTVFSMACAADSIMGNTDIFEVHMRAGGTRYVYGGSTSNTVNIHVNNLASTREFMASAISFAVTVSVGGDINGDGINGLLLRTEEMSSIQQLIYFRAEVDYDGIKYLGGGDKIDLNNANIRAYLKIPGFYPSLASKIVNGGPFKSVSDVYNIPGLTSEEKDNLKKQEAKLITLDVKPEYDIDKINNG